MIPELTNELHLLNGFLLKSALAIVCGGIIGVERELKRKSAGFRTNILICLGSCYFMEVSLLAAAVAGEGRPGDPGRVAAQVVTGIGFLGAGTIIQSRGQIAGLTTAALIWSVASVGLLVGLAHYVLALIATALIFLTLTILGVFERRLLNKKIHPPESHH
ncbi:MAG TPA: MgtC/SapB family protein [Candidatus Polarisedimenticolia bacterium]|nr:MgtC/SapB family protein [Candidatus Polarisedimenticolia bacterium]